MLRLMERTHRFKPPYPGATLPGGRLSSASCKCTDIIMRADVCGSLSYFLQPTFQITWAMSRAVLTVSTTRPRIPPDTILSSSSSYGMNIPLGVRRRPADDFCKSPSVGDMTAPLSRRSEYARDGSHEMSSSSSSSIKKFFDGSTGRRVSWDGDGDSLPGRQPEVWPTECEGKTSGESVRYFRVVDGNFAIVLLSPEKLLRELLLDIGFRCLFDFFIITTPSSDESESLWRADSSSSSSPSLSSTAIHCSTLSSNLMCFLSPCGVCRPDVDRDEK